jgi:hypothetical protein
MKLGRLNEPNSVESFSQNGQVSMKPQSSNGKRCELSTHDPSQLTRSELTDFELRLANG